MEKRNPPGGEIIVNKDESDFMLEEYKQIAKAFADLYPAKDKLLKFYITLISVTSTALGALVVLKFEQLSKIGIDYIDLELGQIIGMLFGILSIVGVLIMCSSIGLRIEMLLYARTINCVRRYFSDNYSRITKYLVLPINDDTPSYREKWNRPFIQEVVMLSILNGILITVSLTMIFKIPIESFNILKHLVIFIIFFAIQLAIFWMICTSRENEYIIRFPSPKEEGGEKNKIFGCLRFR